MTPTQSNKFAELMLSFAITIEAWADIMRRDNTHGEPQWWATVDLLLAGGANLRGAAAQLADLPQ